MLQTYLVIKGFEKDLLYAFIENRAKLLCMAFCRVPCASSAVFADSALGLRGYCTRVDVLLDRGRAVTCRISLGLLWHFPNRSQKVIGGGEYSLELVLKPNTGTGRE